MKTTLELPDGLLRMAKVTAAERGQSLKEFVTEALRDKLLAGRGSRQPEWMQGFGKLKGLHKETVRIQSEIDLEFGAVGAKNRRP
jgi:hypothetical protein